MLYTVETGKTLDETLTAFQNAIMQQGFGVLGVHNLTSKMKEKGVDFRRECRVVEVCNPQQAKTVLEANMDISVALPCRVSIFRESDKTKLATLRPTQLMTMFSSADLQQTAQAVEAALVTAMRQAVA